MGNWQHSAWAALIGGAGSFAYFSALFFGFIQGEEILAKLWLAPRTISWITIPYYRCQAPNS